MRAYKYFFLFFIVLICFSHNSSGQTTKIDSLFLLLSKDGKDTSRVNHLNAIGRILIISKPDTALVLVNEAISLSTQLAWEKGIAGSLTSLGTYYSEKKEISAAVETYSKALTIYRKNNDQSKISASYSNIGRVYANTGDLEKAMIFYSKALDISKTINDKKTCAKILGDMGYANNQHAKNEEALNYYFQSIKASEEAGDLASQGGINNSIAVIYNFQGNFPLAWEYVTKDISINKKYNNLDLLAKDYGTAGRIFFGQGNIPEALNFYLKALVINETLKSKRGIVVNSTNIGLIYQQQKKFSKAMFHYQRALELSEEMGNKLFVSSILTNIGSIYYDQDKSGMAQTYFLSALKIDEELNNKVGIARLYGNMGNSFVVQGDSAKAVNNTDFAFKIKYPNALTYYKKALKLKEELGDEREIILTSNNIGSLYISLSQYPEAEKLIKSSLAKAYQMGSFELESDCERTLSNFYTQTGNYKDALLHFKKHEALRDSLFNADKNQELTRYEMNYEFQKKEAVIKAEQDKKDAVAFAEKKKQQVVIWLVSGVLLLVFIFAGFIFHSLKITRKQKLLIEIKNKETEQQKRIIEEKNKDILDSIHYAQRIQQSLMPTHKYIARNLNKDKKYGH